MIKKYVFDGAPGGGKTTLLFGRCEEDAPRVNYPCLKDRRFFIFSDSIRKVFIEMRVLGKQPLGNLENKLESFQKVLLDETKKFLKVNNKNIVYLFDKGLPGQKMLAEDIDIPLSGDYFRYCDKFRYFNPIFIFPVLEEVDLTEELERGEPTRVFSLERRKRMHKTLINSYLEQGYEIYEIPFYSKNKNENAKQRIKEVLKIINS